MLVPGTFLGDRYEIIELIGSGGMADVYKAKCHKLNRYVAIKVLKSEYATDKSFVSKFRVEAQSAAGLMHPNIVNVYDVGEENGMYYFVMELVEGITLKHYIEKKIRLTVKEAVSIAIQVSMGIEAAHNNGIIHRDIKPQNIIISKEGKVKVADFGIAKAASSDTITSHAMGSVHYTSPEQARGGYSDAKSDIYSIGITLFEMVTGHVPFDGETTVAIAIKHIQEEMPSPRKFVPDIPISVEQIIYKCTQKNPDRRYSNTSQLIRDLKHSLTNPDENFVVIQDPASSEGTKTITEDDRTKIRQQTVMQGPVFSNIIPEYDDNASTESERIQSAGASNQAAPSPYDMVGGYSGNGYENATQYVPGEPYANQQSYAMNEQYSAAAQYAPGEQHAQENAYAGNHQHSMDNYGNGAGEYYRTAQEDDVRIAPDRKRTPVREEEYSMERPMENSRNRKPSSNGRNVKQKSVSGGKRRDDRYKNNQGKARDDYRRSRSQGRYYNDDLEDDVDPKMENVLTAVLVVAAIVVALVAIFVVGKIFGVFKDTTIPNPAESDVQVEAGMTVVPNVVGMSVSEASTALQNAGLTAKATYQESTEYDKDIIVSQDVEANTQVASGTVLNLIVSSGKTVGLTVPDVVGMSEAEAKVAIESEGFSIVKEMEESATVEKGNVISQSPLGATTAPKGSTITVKVSAGVEQVLVKVPELAGKDRATAEKLIADAKLTLGNVTEENNDSVIAGVVLTQSVAEGTEVEEGTSVDLIVSLGPTVHTYTCTTIINAPADYLAGSDAIVVLMDSSGAELSRTTVNAFPYNLDQKGIVASGAGSVTVTYLSNEGAWETTENIPVTFTQEN